MSARPASEIRLFIVLGLIAAGISTLEGLIQSVSTMLTSDLIRPALRAILPKFGRSYPPDGKRRARLEIRINRLVIGLLAIVALFLSWHQLVDPDLSVAIFAQNGVYAYFAAAFVPVLFGTFLKDVPSAAPWVASLVAIGVHFAIYYGRLTAYMQAAVRNPGVAAALAICASVGVALVVLFGWKTVKKQRVAYGKVSSGLGVAKGNGVFCAPQNPLVAERKD